MVYNITYLGLHKLYKIPIIQITSWTSVCLLYKMKNMCLLRKNVNFYAKTCIFWYVHFMQKRAYFDVQVSFMSLIIYDPICRPLDLSLTSEGRHIDQNVPYIFMTQYVDLSSLHNRQYVKYTLRHIYVNLSTCHHLYNMDILLWVIFSL